VDEDLSTLLARALQTRSTGTVALPPVWLEKLENEFLRGLALCSEPSASDKIILTTEGETS
jgi:hypothetical protein